MPGQSDPPVDDRSVGSLQCLDGWLKLENLKGFLAVMSDIVEYRFGELDWGAVEAGLESKLDVGEWFSYPLMGRVVIDVSISPTVEEGDIGVKLLLPGAEACLIEQVRVAWSIFNRFDVSSDVDLLD